ncbi:centromere-associated protein E [Anopheles aquasalis]|uniref:centromere-associated protein E n=1 Tax=Anopheles aquasalis TaxID=42839 RepID=UPI00215B545F|nr:centromere-associated protein E [Anopheles aquasalis]XP_050089769.1 centromere-associated protein E [Anopheles aquasalis]
MASSDNVKVSIKVRPLIKRERDGKLTPQWRVRDNTIATIDGNGEPFVFDHIFDETVPTRQLFETVCRPVIHAALKGINGTIFAYGQTSSGKTYTMIGGDSEPGVVPLTAREIFEEIKRHQDRQFLIRVGFIEIYNEKVHDLLNTANTNLKITENQCGDVSVNSKECITNCAEQILQYVDAGNKARKIGETNMNERSSRSHTIFRITIESRLINATDEETKTDSEAVQIGILNLVDLAGSERADQTGATGCRFKEGVCINRSLLSLSLVIQKLSENSDKQFINYRDSKLTRILQASLGGNAVTSMICNITPAVVDETYYTLSFAMRAKTVKNRPKVNEILTDAAMMKRLEREIKRLQSQLRSEQHKNSKIKTLELMNAITLRTSQFINSNQAQSMQVDSARRRTWCPTSSDIPHPTVSSYARGDGLSLMGPPAPPGLSSYGCISSHPGVSRPTLLVDDDFGASLGLEDGDDECRINFLELKEKRDNLASRMLSTSPMQSGLLNPFAAYEGDEFVPGEQISFGHTSLSPTSAVIRDLRTPVSLRRTRRSSTGDSPTKLNYEERCRVLEQELTELEEFTKLEKTTELQALKEELAKRNEEVGTLRGEIELKQLRIEKLDERCTHLEIELKEQKSRVSKADEELTRSVKERQGAVKEAEHHRNQLTGIEYEYELFRQRSEAREKELIESLQEARSTSASGTSTGERVDQKREEMKRLELQNYDFSLQLETYSKQIEELKNSQREHHRKLEQVKQMVLDYYQLPASHHNDDHSVRLLETIRKTLLLPDLVNENGPTDDVVVPKQNGTNHSPETATPAENGVGLHDHANVTILGEEHTVKELLKIVEQLEGRVVELSALKSGLEEKIAGMAQLQKTADKWKDQLEAQTTEYDELSTQLMDQMQENEMLRKDLATLQTQLTEEMVARKELEAVRQQFQTVQNELKELHDAEMRTQSLEAESIKEQVDRLEKEKASFEKACSEATAECRKWQNKVEELEQRIDVLTAESARSHADLIEAEKKLQTHLTEEMVACKELETVRQQYQTVQNELKELRDAEMRTQSLEVQSIKEQVDRLKEEKASFEKSCSEATAECRKWQNKVEELEQRIDVLTAESARSHTDLIEAEKNYAELAATQKHEKEVHESVQEKLSLELANVRQQVDRLTQEKDQILQQQSGEQQSLVDRLDKLKESKLSLEKRVAEQEGEINQHIATLADAKKEQEECNNRHQLACESYEAAKQKLEQELVELRQAFDQLKEENREQQDNLALQITDLIHSKAQLQEEIVEREKEMLKYIGELEALRSEQIELVMRHNDDRKGLEQELESLQRTVEQLMTENESLLKDQLGTEEAQQRRALAEGEELDRLRSCCDESERLVGQLERDLTKVRAELEKVRNDLVEEKRRHDAGAESERALVQAKHEELERVKDSIHALQDEKVRLIEAEARLQAQLQQQVEQIVQLEQRRDETEATLDELRKENSDLTVAVQELSAKIVNLEEQMDANDAAQRKSLESLGNDKEKSERDRNALQQERDELQSEIDKRNAQNTKLLDEVGQLKGDLAKVNAVRAQLEADIEESSSVRDVLERELASLKQELTQHVDSMVSSKKQYEQECETSANLRRELEEKCEELERIMATGRPSLGDGRVAQALRRENEDLLRQLSEVRQLEGLKGKQLQERMDELQRVEAEIERLRDEMATMRHESSFNEKVEEVTVLQQKIQEVEKVREESVHRQRSLQRINDQLQCKNQTLAKQVEELRRATDKERKSRRQSTHDDRRGLVFNLKDMSTMTDPTSNDCSCLDMDAQIKELRNALKLKECQLNTQKLMLSANPLKAELTEIKRKLQETSREKDQAQQELNEALETLDKERKERKRHCTQCIRHTRQQNARFDKAVQVYQPTDIVPGHTATTAPTAAISLSIFASSTKDGQPASDGQMVALKARFEEQQQQYQHLMAKYEKMKQLCRIRNETIATLNQGIVEKENESVNVNRIQNECVRLKQQLRDAEKKCAQFNRIQPVAGRSSSLRYDVGVQTDNDLKHGVQEQFRFKFETSKAIAPKLKQEGSTD